jgi:hypothetical protein
MWLRGFVGVIKLEKEFESAEDFLNSEEFVQVQEALV